MAVPKEAVGLQPSRSFKVQQSATVAVQQHKEIERQNSKTISRRRKQEINLALLPALLPMYLIGAALAILVCIRSFLYLQEFHLQSVDHLTVNTIITHNPRLNKFQSAIFRRMTSRQRRQWLKDNWSTFDFLESEKQFTARMKNFFSNRCEERFFFTWIAPTAGSFGAREQLSLQSVFRWHPSACVVILSRSLDTPKGAALLAPFVAKGFKVMAVSPDHDALFQGTAAESWFARLKEGKQDPGDINLMQNLSNVLRLAALYKYGGIYLDTDVIVLRKMSKLRNCVGAQSMNSATGKWKRLNNAVLVFDKNHRALLKLIQQFDLAFDGRKWGHNGPYLLSSVMRNHRLPVTVLPKSAFYPYNWLKIRLTFRAPKKSSVLQQVCIPLLKHTCNDSQSLPKSTSKRSFLKSTWNLFFSSCI